MLVLVTYMMPSWTWGVPCSRAAFGTAKTHFNARRETLDLSICVIAGMAIAAEAAVDSWANRTCEVTSR